MAGRESALRRILRMAGMSAGITGSYAGYLAQRAFLADEERERKLKSTHQKVGRRMSRELSALRGPAMKLGQTLSLQIDVVPEEIIEQVMTLQMRAPGMHPSLARAQFKASMGRLPEQIFRSFDNEPFAAASLGQVHHALTRDGKKVAVKIQYPSIQSAIASDFKLLRTLTASARITGHIPGAVIDEAEQQIMAEIDYRREANNIDFFRAHLSPMKYVVVPEVYREYSTDSVLTMSLLAGDHLEAYLARQPSQEQRDEMGTHLFEMFYFQILTLGAFHADPHWGNYLFSGNGKVGLVDFGCVKHMSPKFVENMHALFLYPGDRKSAEFLQLLEQRHLGQNRRAALRALVEVTDGFYRRVYPPEREKEDEAFNFGEAAFLQQYMSEAARLFRRKGTRPEDVFLARAELGLYQTLHRLRSRVQTSKIVRKFLRRQRA